jgi:hypothetical protein
LSFKNHAHISQICAKTVKFVFLTHFWQKSGSLVCFQTFFEQNFENFFHLSPTFDLFPIPSPSLSPSYAFSPSPYFPHPHPVPVTAQVIIKQQFGENNL